MHHRHTPGHLPRHIQLRNAIRYGYNAMARAQRRHARRQRLRVIVGVISCLFLAGIAFLLSGCTGPRVVFVPTTNAPVRAGPNVTGRVYVWTGSAWELSGNSVKVPEGLYIWDTGDGTNNLAY